MEWMKKILKFLNKYRLLTIGLIALAFIIIGVKIDSLWITTLGTILLIIAIGDGFLIIGIEKRIAEILRISFPLAQQAFAYRLEEILDPRRTKDGHPYHKTFDTIGAVLESYIKNRNEEKKFIKLCGISLKDFFDAPTLPAVIIARVFQDPKDPEFHFKNIEVQAIILDPDSDSAHRRAKDEVDKSNRVYNDIKHTVDYCDTLRKRRSWPSDVSLTLKTAKVFPPAYFIIIGEYIFIEQYHIGRESGSVDYECLGGTLPMLRFKIGSGYYTFFNKQFDFLWKVESNQDENQFYGVRTICEIPAPKKRNVRAKGKRVRS